MGEEEKIVKGLKLQKASEEKRLKNNKPQPALIPPEVIIEVAKVFHIGVEKYGKNDWMEHVTKSPDDFYNACLRHLYADMMGDKLDTESGLPHLAHAITNLMFLLWKQLKEESNE